MKLANNYAQQRHILILGFLLFFCVSLVLILFEKIQKQELALQTKEKYQPVINAVVQGEQIVRDPAIVNYQNAITNVVEIIFSNISKLEQKEIVTVNDLAPAKEVLFNLKVPIVYQKLHFKLTQILNFLSSDQKENLDYLLEQRQLLKEEFPWLNQAI